MNPAAARRDWDGGTMKRPQERIVDQLLVMRCQDGEAEAMDRLVRRWQRPLWRHAYRLTANAEAAWEATQEAWLGIVRGIRRLDDPARFRAWAFRIVTRKAVDWIRHRRRRRRDQVLEEHEAAAPPPAGNDEADRAAAMLKRLAPSRRAILSLRYLEGLSNAEIADALGVPEGTVKSRLHHARNELRRLLEGEQS
jgi:RNA polymerase sigma-70 factor (ECF subfamily)